MCCKPYVYFICNCAAGKHFPLSLFQLWTLLRTGKLWLLLERFLSWFIFSIHFFANRGKFKSLGKLLEITVERVWVIQKAGPVRGSDDRSHKLCIRAGKRYGKKLHFSVSGVSRCHVTLNYQMADLDFWLQFSRDLSFKSCI